MAGRKSSPGWLGRIRRRFLRIPHVYRHAQQWWWYHADHWLLSAPSRYLKALPVLILWVGTAVLLFRCLVQLLPDQVGSREDKESIALLGSLLTALIGFGLQQWKGQEEEERRRREEEARVLGVIEEEFPELLRKDLSAAARRYVEFRRKGGVWQSRKVRASRERIWEGIDRPELRCAVAVIEQFPESKCFDPAEQTQSLLWAYNNLDDEWRSRAASALISMEKAFPEWTEEAWRAVLGICPAITLGRGLVAIPDLWILQGLQHLGLRVNPFGSEVAEADAYLLKARVIPSWWRKLEALPSGLFFTAPGGGRTAAALLLAYDVLLWRSAFPIYCQVAETPLGLDDLARWTAKAVARYIALSPISFTRCSYSAKTAIKRLLSSYLPTDPVVYLQQVGLPSVGEGGKVLEEFKTHLAASPDPVLSPSDLLALLGEARPADFPRTLIMADVQGTVEDREAALHFYALGDALDRVGVTFQAFLAVSPSSPLRRYGEFLEWLAEDLRSLLQRRLRLLSSDESLDAWCDGKEKWEGPSAEERFIAAAGQSPQTLIRLGNALLRRIGEREQLLTSQDLDDVLDSAR